MKTRRASATKSIIATLLCPKYPQITGRTRSFSLRLGISIFEEDFRAMAGNFAEDCDDPQLPRRLNDLPVIVLPSTQPHFSSPLLQNHSQKLYCENHVHISHRNHNLLLLQFNYLNTNNFTLQSPFFCLCLQAPCHSHKRHPQLYIKSISRGKTYFAQI